MNTLKPLYRNNVVTDDGQPVHFETDTGTLIVLPTAINQGKILLSYEFHPRIPELKQPQRN